MVVDTRPVLPFAELGRADVPVAGGKGASLGELLRAGIRVPDGFVVTTTAFRQAVAHLTVAGEPVAPPGAALAPADPAVLAAETARLREAVETAPLPPAVAEAVAAG